MKDPRKDFLCAFFVRFLSKILFFHYLKHFVSFEKSLFALFCADKVWNLARVWRANKTGESSKKRIKDESNNPASVAARL